MKTAFLFDNRGERREYWVGLQPGDRLRARQTVWSKGDGGDFTYVYDYEAFRAGEVYAVQRVESWGNTHRVGFVPDEYGTLHMALVSLFERVP